ncbi:MAG TPA: hypothetical protein DCY20_05610 [Firmicutes bacterium]|nr:hypothetical protein [Bacillota bacterium]
MFGKSKKNQQAPIDEMERFYLDQFFNSNKQPTSNQTNFFSDAKKGFGIFGKNNQPMQQMGMPVSQTTMGDPNLNLDSYLFKNPNQDLHLMGRPNPLNQMGYQGSAPLQEPYGYNNPNGQFQQSNPSISQNNGFFNVSNDHYYTNSPATSPNIMNPNPSFSSNQPSYNSFNPNDMYAPTNSTNSQAFFNPTIQNANTLQYPQGHTVFSDSQQLYQQQAYQQQMLNPLLQTQDYSNVTNTLNMSTDGYNPTEAYYYNSFQATPSPVGSMQEVSTSSSYPTQVSQATQMQPTSFETPTIKHYVPREEAPFHLQVSPITAPLPPQQVNPTTITQSPLTPTPSLLQDKTLESTIEEHDHQLLLLNHRVMRLENILKSHNMN